MSILLIEKCVQGGAGLARLPNGSVCFVEGALPGEAVEINITKQKKDFSEARIAKILEPNKKRREAPCPYYGKCGGCNAQHAEFDYQVELLKEIIADLFARVAKINLPQIEIHSAGEWNYRCRAQVFKKDGKIGFLARGTNDIIEVKNCMTLTDKLNEYFCNESSPLLEGWQVGARHALPLQDGVYLERGKAAKYNFFDNQTEKYLSKHIYADESVFFQSNLEMLSKLIEEVKKAAGKGEFLLDIYAGVGLFSAFLQDDFERIIAVEQNPLCEKFAKQNLGKNCEFLAIDAENFNFIENDCLLIDPPRTGLSNKVCNAIKSKKIIYVSCNPATLARDTRKLLDKGYKLQSIRGFAFYPQTFHVEMLAVFRSYN